MKKVPKKGTKIEYIDADGNKRVGIVMDIIKKLKDPATQYLLPPIFHIVDDKGNQVWLPLESINII